jgi:hypothetical protein
MNSHGEGLEGGNIGVQGVTVIQPNGSNNTAKETNDLKKQPMSQPMLYIPPVSNVDVYGNNITPSIDQPRVKGSIR